MTRADIPTSYDEAVGLVGGENGRKTICNNTVVEVSKPMNTAYYGGQGLAYVLLHGHNVVAFREDGSEDRLVWVAHRHHQGSNQSLPGKPRVGVPEEP